MTEDNELTHWVPISQTTRDMLRTNAESGRAYRENGKVMRGHYCIPLSDDVMEQLDKHRMPGESYDDVIQRALSTLGGIARQ